MELAAGIVMVYSPVVPSREMNSVCCAFKTVEDSSRLSQSSEKSAEMECLPFLTVSVRCPSVDNVSLPSETHLPPKAK